MGKGRLEAFSEGVLAIVLTMGENGFAAFPVALYGVVLLMATLAYHVLSLALIRHEGPDSALAAAVGRDVKGNVSRLLYAAAIALAFVNRWVSLAF